MGKSSMDYGADRWAYSVAEKRADSFSAPFCLGSILCRVTFIVRLCAAMEWYTIVLSTLTDEAVMLLRIDHFGHRIKTRLDLEKTLRYVVILSLRSTRMLAIHLFLQK